MNGICQANKGEIVFNSKDLILLNEASDDFIKIYCLRVSGLPDFSIPKWGKYTKSPLNTKWQ
jgi:hypothetical protein